MRLFQNSGVHSSYYKRLNELASAETTFAGRRRVLLHDRFGALHFLKPALDGDESTFFTNGDDEILQNAWAKEHGMRATSIEDILLAQVEHHNANVFYNTDPTRYGGELVRRLPGCVKKTICWRAAPSGRIDLSSYGAVVCNFPSILEDWRKNGCRVDYFFPAVDPAMNEYGHGGRPIDVLFVGSYSRHHSARSSILEEFAKLAPARQITLRLDVSRMTRIGESPLGRLIPALKKHGRPQAIAAVAGPPVFGRDLYELLGKAKIVLNGAIDMAGRDRGNMRCFESMGCGALLLSDAGNYPQGMSNGDTIVTYQNAAEAVRLAEAYLTAPEKRETIAQRGREAVNGLYNKTAQWQRFCEIVASL